MQVCKFNPVECNLNLWSLVFESLWNQYLHFPLKDKFNVRYVPMCGCYAEPSEFQNLGREQPNLPLLHP